MKDFRFGVLTFLVSAGTVWAGTDAIDQTWLAKAKIEGKAAVERFLRAAERVEEESETRTVHLSKPPGSKVDLGGIHRWRILHLGANMIVWRMHISDATPTKAFIGLECSNLDYQFTLRKVREDSPYALVDYSRGKAKLPLTAPGREFGLHGHVLFRLRAAIHAMGATDSGMKALVDSGAPEMRQLQTRLRALQYDKAKALLRVQFTNTVQNPLTILEYDLSLEPGNNWRLVAYDGPEVRAQIKYGAVIAGVEFPTEQREASKSKLLGDCEHITRVTSIKITDKTPEDFRLSAFGLPEPVDVAPLPPKSAWYLWLIGAGVGCLGLALFFGHLRRRKGERNAVGVKSAAR